MATQQQTHQLNSMWSPSTPMGGSSKLVSKQMCSTPAQVNLCAPACNLLLAAALPSFDNVRTRWQYLVSLSMRDLLGHRLPARNAPSC